MAWFFDLPTARDLSPAMAMSVQSCRILRSLTGFAVPVAAEWTTRSAGEDAVVHPRGTLIDEALLEATFRDHPDVEVLGLDLDLVVTAPDGVTEAVIRDGAWLVVEQDGEHLTGDLRLNVDVHARRTWGHIPDNETLARLNAPRLATFLTRLREKSAARVRSVETRDPFYQDQFTYQGQLPAIIRAPEDDALRLAMAEFIRPAEPDRAAFISYQVRAAQRERVAWPPGLSAWSVEERELLARHETVWTEPLARYVAPARCIFHRGLIAHVTLEPEIFIEHGAHLLRQAPIRHVDFTPLRPGVLPRLLACEELVRLDSIGFPGAGLDGDAVAAIAACPLLGDCLYLDFSRNRLGPGAFSALAASPHLRRLLVVERAQDSRLDPVLTWHPGEIVITRTTEQGFTTGARLRHMTPEGHALETAHGHVPWLHLDNRVARYDARWFVEQGLRLVSASDALSTQQ
jgi:uncharacterized protein (TIGR02996 family)